MSDYDECKKVMIIRGVKLKSISYYVFIGGLHYTSVYYDFMHGTGKGKKEGSSSSLNCTKKRTAQKSPAIESDLNCIICTHFINFVSFPIIKYST